VYDILHTQAVFSYNTRTVVYALNCCQKILTKKLQDFVQCDVMKTLFVGERTESNTMNKIQIQSRPVMRKTGIVVTKMVILISVLTSTVVSALVANQPVSKLLQIHSSTITKLKEICQLTVSSADFQRQPYCNDIFYLRYCLASSDDDDLVATAATKLKSTLQWRMSEQGQVVCNSAVSAIENALAGGKWNNDPVLNGAPNSAVISKYITPSCAMTTVSNQNDLVYCIRAGYIDDVGLMSSVSIDEMVNFFLYAKEVNSIVANIRSEQLDKLLCIVTCNDLSNVKLIGGSSDFRKALSTSSTIANDVYSSSYSGPTLLLNLPLLVAALVQLFTPLFPKAVKDRLKFQQGPLKDVNDLRQVASQSQSLEYKTFMKQLDDLLYKNK
jgi:hypothetical protein